MEKAEKAVGTDEIEITPEMVEAGVLALRKYFGDEDEPRENFQMAVSEVFSSMAAAGR